MGHVDRSVLAVRVAVRATLADLVAAGLGPGDLVLVACSGGSDSLALAAAVAHESRRVGRSVRSRGFAVRAAAVVVDHGLQPGSDDVAAAAAQQCRGLGLDPVVVRRVVVGHDGVTGLEDAARRARYAAFDDVAASTGAVAVLLGHTLDDQAEQVLLGLARGSGARTLAGIPPARGIYRRPLLGLRRAQLRAACAAQGLDWWDDPTNDLPPSSDRDMPHGPVPLRTRVRHEVLPLLEDVLGPGTAESLARSATQLRADADALDDAAATLLADAKRPTPPPAPDLSEPREPLASPPSDNPASDNPAEVRLDVGVLAAAPAAVRRRALRAAALAVGAPPGATGAKHVDALDALVVGWHGQGAVGLPSGASARRACGTLVLHRGPGPS
ncbi:tRNA(Ile)-lysidine synthetase [Xylanimonas cellulosilytica DSM 15894]|uniref:tRNA(Ile)-lysidine synthase n=1 Tax=Xylanimonas cellulosilytica (strain DSM 15894 / JCM 12276 / CECT 5975 / KCTC 9989 / LMG 20990 / NBRC 107835 / XIL07) TaxID=446471 RepID=D1BZ98_XYLCX|nr:tRNA lysidine(34) synthetase TilS [Xylanimonas cellulosilytica]ACZ31995.1 tRNA(Ile)-lysidine synthetase [Xylanimonas cellulosilytica DSM 15894]